MTSAARSPLSSPLTPILGSSQTVNWIHQPVAVHRSMRGAMTNLTLTKLIHVNQRVDDFDAARAFYAEVFGAREYWTGYDDAERRDASLFVVGDACIELFAPRDCCSLLGASL